MTRHHRAGVLLAAALVLLSGCSAEPAAPPESGTRSVPAVSIEGLEGLRAVVDYDTGTVALPSDAYSTNSPEYFIRVLHAIAVRTDECMVDQGFPAIAGETDWAPFPDEEDRYFGRWSPALASQYGAERSPTAGPPPIALVERGPEFNNAYNACTESAKETLMDLLLFSQKSNLAMDIRFGALDMAKNTDAGKEALQDWRDCSEQAGIVLDPTDHMPVEEYKTQGKEAEIAAYTTHAECAQSTGAIQQISDLRVQYETALIDAQQAQLNAFLEERDRVIAALDAAIAAQ